MTDAELLSQYAQNKSEAAFAELVRRHAGWIHSAALRQLHNTHLAQPGLLIYPVEIGRHAEIRTSNDQIYFDLPPTAQVQSIQLWKCKRQWISFKNFATNPTNSPPTQ